MKRRSTVLIILIIVSLTGINLFSQEVFSNGVDVAGTYVFGNGLITNAQDDAAVRDVATSIGQLYGIDPDTGTNISNEALLTVKPKKRNLETTANRQFVISADQITGDGSVTVDYSGSNVVLGLSETNVQVQGDLVVSNTITLGGVARATWPEGDNLGDHTATQNIKLNGHWLSGDGDNEGIYITDTGKIGVGITNPVSGFKLDLYGNGSGLAIRDVGGSDNKVLIRFTETPYNWDQEFEILGMFAGVGATGNKLKFRSVWTDNVLVMRGDGNIGIGSSNPAEKLTVVGNADVSGNFHAMNLKIGAQHTASGSGSFAQGYNCSASASYSHAEGYFSQASGSYGAHAEGQNTIAATESSHAEGKSTWAWLGIASHAEGYICETDGDYSHAEGDYNWARGHASHVEGYYNVAHGDESHAAGAYALAEHNRTYVWSDGGANGTTVISSTTNNQFTVHAKNGIRLLGGPISGDGSGLTNISHVAYLNIGIGNTISSDAVGTGAFVQGTNCTALGENSHAEGVETIASGEFGGAHAEGSYTIASGCEGAHAEGSGTTASGFFSSHAEGSGTTASGWSAHAEGSGTTASGEFSHAEGMDTTASGYSSHASGEDAKASGYCSHSEGDSTVASGDHSYASGWLAHAVHDSTYVWSDGGANGTTVISSTTNNQYTVYAKNGIRLLGGPTEISEIVPAGDLAMGIYTNHP